jgi:hypothetical protein
MVRNTRSEMWLSAAVLGSLAGAAHGATFSFASDTNPNDFTFAGFGGNVTDAQDPTDPVVLLVDDNNGPLPAMSFNVEFDADFTVAHVDSAQVAPGVFTHSYALNGTFSFSQGGTDLLRCTITDGAMVALGGQATWGSTDTILGSDNPGSVEYTWLGADLPGYGVFNGASIGIDDAAFTLTFLQSALGSGVALNPANMLPGDEWTSEGSFSGTAFFIPSPGALALLGIGGLATGRRRR